MNARQILEGETPKRFIRQVAPRFDERAISKLIRDECPWCMDDPPERLKMWMWVKQHANLFPDVKQALEAIQNNDSWCFASRIDIYDFFEASGVVPKVSQALPFDEWKRQVDAEFTRYNHGSSEDMLTDHCLKGYWEHGYSPDRFFEWIVGKYDL